MNWGYILGACTLDRFFLEIVEAKRGLSKIVSEARISS